MAGIPEIIPISDLHRDSASVLDRLRHSRDPVVIMRRDRAAAVLLSVAAYEALQEENAMLRALLRGESEIGIGQGASLDSVLRQADQLLDGR